MKLLSVKIKNFRSIRYAEISGPINDVWTFIGQNNAGKSSVIHAIRAFYGEYNITPEDFCRTGDEQIEITLEYKLSDEEFKQLPDFYKLPKNKLRVVKRFSKDNLKGESHGFELKDGKIIEREEEFFGARNVQIGKLGNIIYIPAVKDLSEELKNTRSSIFSKLISRVISEALIDLPSWNELVKQAENFARDLRSPKKDSKNNDLRSVHEIEDNLGRMLSSWRLRPQILVSPPTPEDIVLSGAKLKFISEDTKHEEDPFALGSGAQRSIVNSLLQLWASIESKKKKGDKKKFNGDLTLLLYEEPEALLHYDQEKKLLKNLEDIAKSDTSQVIICTHSPNLISTKSKVLSSILRYVKEGTETKIFRASKAFLDQLSSEENIFDFILWLNPDRNTMFFVDKVILVEGPADKALLNYIIQTEDLKENVYVVDCGGKQNIPRFMKLCSEFGIRHCIMFDEDNNRTENHRRWNSEIKSEKNKYTIGSLIFKTTMEDYINFSTADRNKPVEVLNQLKEGKLTEDKKREFINLIQS